MKVDPVITFWLMFAATCLQGLTSGAVHLAGIVPAAALPTVTGWMGLVLFFIMTFLTLATGFSSSKSGPLAPAPTIPEAKAVLKVAEDAQEK